MPIKRSPARPPPSVPAARRTHSSALPHWRAMPTVTVKPPGSSAQQTQCAAHGLGSLQGLRRELRRRRSCRTCCSGRQRFESAWAEGSALSTDEAVAYAQRGRGERKRPTNGWGSLTPTERDVVRLVSEGLCNKDIATRLFISPRTVGTHLTHVYTKLGLTTSVQLAQEATRRT